MHHLLSYINWSVDPEIFTIPGVDWPIRWYGLMWAIGLILSQQIMYHIFKVEQRPAKHVDTLTLYIILATFLGARFGHFLFYDPSVFITDPLSIILPPYAGLASHGAAIGILIGPTTVPWAFVFELVDNVPRHPAQLYEAIYCFLLFGLLYYIWKVKRHQVATGFIFGVFLVVLWSLRFVDEFFKEVQEPFEENLPLNMGQILSIPFVIAGLVILIKTRKRRTVAQ